MTRSSAPAKIILFGEHAVVYGHPALAVPVTEIHADVDISNADRPGIWIHAPDVNIHAELNALPSDHPLASVIHNFLFLKRVSPFPSLKIDIHSTIPVASGLGSGAAVTVALLVLVIVASVVVVRFGAVLLELTGMPWEQAKFQSLSAFSNSGFTTREAEDVMRHPVRRRIVTYLIIIGKEIFLYCPNGYGITKLSNNFFENKLKVNATTRNWKTVNKLVEMADNLL